jgi:aspartyl-tRNA(Asn)/glutamyl-tRNA(Gln) amidotransferase subunit C
MRVDENLIKRIGELARINLTEKEISKFKSDFKEILDSFSKLDEVNVDDVKPSYQPVALKNFMREDKISECLSQSKALENSKNTKDGYFKGPKAV